MAGRICTQIAQFANNLLLWLNGVLALRRAYRRAPPLLRKLVAGWPYQVKSSEHNCVNLLTQILGKAPTSNNRRNAEFWGLPNCQPMPPSKVRPHTGKTTDSLLFAPVAIIIAERPALPLPGHRARSTSQGWSV